jgi:hypothetical protein
VSGWEVFAHVLYDVLLTAAVFAAPLWILREEKAKARHARVRALQSMERHYCARYQQGRRD